MKLTWLCTLALLLGLVSCSRNDENPQNSADKPAEKNAPVNLPEVLEFESQVIRVANSLASAAEGKDVKGVMAAFSKDVQISVGGANKTPREFTYETYEAYLASAFPLISAYKYKRFSESMRKVGDDIVFSFILNESYEAQGQRMNETHTETWHLRQGPTGLQIYQVRIDP